MNVSYRLVVLAAIFVTCIISANILIVKQIAVAGLTLPAAIIIFPLSYIISDILTEVYGYRQARRIIWLGFLCNLIAVIAFWIGKVLPPAEVFGGQEAYEIILGSTPRFLLASFVGYIAGEFTNSFILAKMKIMTGGKWLWSRTIGSTLAGEGIDTVFALTIALAGVLPWSVLGGMIIAHWLLKTAYEIIITPFTYYVVNYLKRKEGLDVYDIDTNFNPLQIN